MYYKKNDTKKLITCFFFTELAILLQVWATFALQKKMLFWMDGWRVGWMNQWIDDGWVDVRMDS